MIGDHHKIERTRELNPLPAGRDNLLSLAEPIAIGRTDAGAERARIKGERRVQMRIAEKRPGRKIASRVRRVRRFAGEGFSGLLLIERADVGLHLRQHRHCDAGSGRRGDLYEVTAFDVFC